MNVILDYRQYSHTVRLAIFPVQGMGGCIGHLVFDREVKLEFNDWDMNTYATCISVSLLSSRNACLQSWYYFSPRRDRNHLINCVVGTCKGDIQLWQRLRQSVEAHMIALDSGLTPIILSASNISGEIVVQPARTPVYARCGGLIEASFAICLPDGLRFIAPNGTLRYGG